MKVNNALKNYSWNDIIAPIQANSDASFFNYFAITLIVLVFLYLLIRFTKTATKIRFLLISYRLKNSNYSRKYIKQLITLFSFDKKMQYKQRGKKIIEYRYILLSAYYAKNTIDNAKINDAISHLWKII